MYIYIYGIAELLLLLLLSLWFVLASNSPATCLCLSLLSCCLTADTVYKLSSRFSIPSLHLAALLRGHNSGQGGNLMLVLMLMLIDLLLLVLADALVMLAGFTFAHVIDKRTLLVLLAEGAILAHLLLCFQLFTFLCKMRK